MNGLGSISQAGATTTILQTSAGLTLNWKSFNIGAQETVNFVQPSASAIAVNRILDTNGSQILGHLNANGQVWLINPNGILFGQGAQVNVAGLVASTLDLGDADPGGITRTFSGAGSGSVINRGSLNAADGGYVALLGNRVANEGRIEARLGTVALGAGSAITLNFNGNSLVKMQVERSVLDSEARNGGLIRADGGRVLMSAGAKDALLASVVNNTGVIEARTVEAHEGEIILLGGMAAGSAQVGGTLDASAPNGGNGGFIETSAANVAVARDSMITTAAPAAMTGKTGKTGTWLIDPYNVTISNAAGNTGGSFAANTNDSIINAATLQTALANTNVTVTTGSGGAQAGNITVAAPLTWSAPSTLTLTAAGAIAINAPISITGAGGLSLTASAQTGITSTGLTFSHDGSVSFAGGGGITGQSFALNGQNYTLVYSMAQLDAIDALNAVDGSALAGYGAGLTGNYALASSLVATGTTYTRALVSTDSSGLVTAGFTGRFDGLGNTITGLTINAGTLTDAVGLFGAASGATLSNIGLVNASVSGHDNVGALLGYSWGATIQTSYASSDVTGSKNVGGLVGGTRSFTLIQSSYSGGTVAGVMYTGGLVGDLNFTSALTTSYSTSAVSGVDYTGGLAGDVSLSTVRDSYSSGAVTGTTNTGGLIGRFNTSPSALVTGAFWNTQTSGQATSAGGAGAVGLNSAQMNSLANFSSATAANGNLDPAWDFSRSWAMYDGLSTPLLRSFLTPLLVSANSTTKTYDGQAYAGVNSASYSVTPGGNLFGTVSYADTSQGAVNAGSYAVTPSGLYSNQQGYAISYAAGGLTVAPATLTVTANAASRVYGSVDPAFSGSVSGFVTGDTLANATTGSEVFATSALVNANVGGHAINGSGLSANNGNYVFVQAAGNATALTITPATLTVTANAASRLYGAAEPSFSGSVTGFVAGDTLASATTGSEIYSTSAALNSNIGSYGVTGSGLSANNGNYLFVQAAGNATALTITPATLSYVSNAATRVYGAADPAFSGSVSGFAAGDTQASATTGSAAYTSGGTTLNSNVGSYSITGSGLNANNGNYVFTQAPGNATALTITPAALVYTAAAASRLYGAADPVFSGSMSGFVAGDTLSTATTGSAVYASTTAITSNVGSYGITGSGLSANNGNYVFTQAPGNATALTITPATLTVTANAATRLYGATEPSFSGSVSGFVAGDTLATATTGSEIYSTSAAVNSNVGSYGVTGSGLSANNGNYLFVQAAGNATALTITPATLSYISNAASRMYGAANPTFSGSVSGFVAGDTLASATTGSAAYASSGTTPNSNVGQYGITGSGLAANNGNYVFTQAPGNASALTINPATLTITANAATRLYGAAEPSFSGSVSGFVAGDTLASATTGSEVYSSSAAVNSNVGSYGVTGSGLSANNGNYLFVQASGNATALTITPATLSYISNAATRVYGAANPAFSGSVSGLVAGDTLASATTGSAVYASASAVNSNVGSYGINGSGLSANNGNYVFVQAPGNAAALTITPATLSYVSNAASRLFGAAEPVFSGTLAGFVAGDTQATATTGSIAYTTDALATSAPGSYAINGGGLSANAGNYVLVQAASNATALTVAAAPPPPPPPPSPPPPSPPPAAPDPYGSLSREAFQSLLASLSSDANEDSLSPAARPSSATQARPRIVPAPLPASQVIQGGLRLPEDALGGQP